MKFLVLKTSSLGDLIHTFQAVHTLRTHFPTSQIDWLVEERYKELILAHTQIDHVFYINTKGSKYRAFKALKNLPSYDVIFDLQGNIKSGLILSQLKSDRKVGFGFKTVSEWPNMLFTNERYNPPKKQNIRSDLSFMIEKALQVPPIFTKPPLLKNETPFEKPVEGGILICPGSIWKNKKLSIDQLGEVIKGLKKAPLYILQGSPEELLEAEKLNASLGGVATILPKMPLSALQHFMNGLDLVIGVDSLPLHLAGTTKTATLSFFGPSLGKKYAPLGSLIYQGECPYGVTFEKRCPHLRVCKTGACLKNLTMH
jgi:heptosyltransferase-1